MDTQEAYELMRIYLTRPGARQATVQVGNPCNYEINLDGFIHRCAVGCLLTESTLSQEVMIGEETDLYSYKTGDIVRLRDFMGNLSVLGEVGFRLPELDQVDLGFLDEAQSIHDNHNNWSENGFIVEILDDLARRFKLEVVTDEPQGAPQEEGAQPVFA